jgi:hypothetical protein
MGRDELLVIVGQAWTAVLVSGTGGVSSAGKTPSTGSAQGHPKVPFMELAPGGA